jgi:hypothetical protein
MVYELARKDRLIIALNAGSSLRIRSSDGRPLLQRHCIHESSSDALDTLTAGVRGHMDTTPAAVEHGGPNLCRHEIIGQLVPNQPRSRYILRLCISVILR